MLIIVELSKHAAAGTVDTVFDPDANADPNASQNTPALWFIVSLGTWSFVALLVWLVFKRMQFKSQGLTTIRTRFNRKVLSATACDPITP